MPHGNAIEARLVPGLAITDVSHLQELLPHQQSVAPRAPNSAHASTRTRERTPTQCTSKPTSPPDMSDVIGQVSARHALEVAAAGGHNLLFVGPPGTGKTMLAERMSTILPPLTDEQAVSVTSIHSLSGTLNPTQGLITQPRLRRLTTRQLRLQSLVVAQELRAQVPHLVRTMVCSSLMRLAGTLLHLGCGAPEFVIARV